MKTFQKIIGVIFLIITISASLLASDQQKNYPNINNSNNIFSKPYNLYARSTNYYKGEKDGDTNTNNNKTASLIPISLILSKGLGVVAVDPKIIPYGSIVIYNNKKYIASDTGGAVKTKKASRLLANKKGLNYNSREYNAPVLDFYNKKSISNNWDTFIVIPYIGPEFKNKLNYSEKISHIEWIRKFQT